jgi:ankyrin repeat protein
MPNAVIPSVARDLLLVLATGLVVFNATTADSPVADAAMRGDTAKVRQLLKQGADVNAAQGDGMTALHWAAQRGDMEGARMLVYAGARVEATTRNGSYTPLHLASRVGKVGVIKALLQGGANANASTSSGGATPLHFAAGQGNPDAVTALVEGGAKVDGRDAAWGQTPLMWAAAANRVDAIRVLIAKGADIKATSKVEDIPARDRDDRAALQLRNRRVAALKAADQPVLTAPPGGGRGGRGGEQPAVVDGRGGAPAGAARGAAAPGAVASAARPDSAAATPPIPPPSNAQRQAEAQPQIGGTQGANAQAAAQGGEGGRQGRGGGGERGLGYADLIGNKGGLTALLFAIREGHVEATQALLKAGADINQVSAGDHTSPLLMAAINGHFDVAKLLLERGANVKLASDAGATPLYAVINIQWAAKSLYPQPTAQTQQKTTHLELMEAMLKAGADPNARLSKHLWYMSYNFDLLGVNTVGATPFWRAAYGLDIPAMKLLIAYKADPNIPTSKPAGRQISADGPAEEGAGGGGRGDPSGLPPVATGGPGVYAIHAASGVGYGEGFAANSHMHAPDSWLPAMKYLIEELKLDPNARDMNGYNALHHAAARGDNELILYLVSKGVDIKAVSRRGQTVADMANGPVQRITPFLETVALTEKLGSKNSHQCKSC